MKIKAFTSDTHYYHHNIIKYCNRPYDNIHHMNKSLIQNYNSIITDNNDLVIWVGDCFFCSTGKSKEIMNQLNGRKILIRGNHDNGPLEKYLELGFELVVDTHMMIEIEGVTTKICHFDYRRENSTVETDKYYYQRPERINKNEILLHGHIHSLQRNIVNNQIDVGVDCNNYKPILFDDVALIIRNIKETNNAI